MRSIHPALLLSLLLVGPALAHEINPVTSEFVATSRTDYDQHDVWVGCDDRGNFVLSYAQGDIYVRRFDRDGQPAGDDLLVNTLISYGTQDETYLAMDPSSGDFFAGFSDRAGNDGDLMAAGGRFFRADGTAYGPDQILNVTTFESQFEPHAAYMPNGRIMVVWGDSGQDGSSGCVGRIFQRDGTALSPEFLINEPSSATQIDPSVACSRNGLFVCAYVDASGATGEPREVLVRRFDQYGAALGPSQLVNTESAGMQRDPIVAVSGLGAFVVVWQDENGQDGDGNGVFARRFDASGNPQGSQFQVNTTTAGNQQDPHVSMDYVGNFAVTFESDATGDLDVLVRLFDRNGNSLSGELRAHENAAGQQHQGKSCLVQSGQRMITVWHDATSDGQVYARVFDLPVITASGGAAIGESVTFDLDIPGQGGRSFALLPSLAMSPRLGINGWRFADLAPDQTMELAVANLSSGLFGTLTGTLDSNGQGQASFSVPDASALYNQPIHFAAVTIEPGYNGTWDVASGALEGVEFLSEALTVTVDGPPRFHPGTELYGEITSSSDEDWASFEATRKEKLKFKLVAVDESLAGAALSRITVEILNADQQVLKSWTKNLPAEAGKKKKLAFKAPDHGTYLLRLKGDAGALGHYRIQTRHKLKKKAREQSKKVKVDDSLFASLKLDAVQDTVLAVMVKPLGAAPAPSTLELENPSGSTDSYPGAFTSGGDGKYYLEDLNLIETGRYKVRIGGLPGDKYKLKVTPVPPTGPAELELD